MIKGKFSPGHWVLLVLIFFLAIPTQAISQNGPEGSSTLELGQIPTAPESSIDLTEILLKISRQRDPSLNIALLEAELNKLTETVRSRLLGQPSGDQVVQVLRQVIHQETGLRYTDDVDSRGIPVNPAELFLHGLLQTKKGYCMNLSLIYLVIGDKLDLPLYGVALPNHFFVRYESDGTRINIEATESGASYPDDFYRQRFGLASGNESFFMKNLSRKQTLGAYFSNVGMVYYQDQQVKKAIFYLDLATEINALSIEAQNNLANIYTEQKNWDKALKHYHLALNADPGNISTLFNLGLAYKGKGSVPQAVDSLLQVVQIDPGFALAHQILINLFSEIQRPYAAMLHLKKLAALNPQNLQTKIALATLLLDSKQYAMALDQLNHLRQQNRDHPLILENLAEAHYRLNDFDRSIEFYRYLLELNPENLKAYIQLGWNYYRKGDTLQAQAWTNRGLNLGQGSNQWKQLATMNLGFFAVLNQNFAKAKEMYLQVLAAKNAASIASMVADLDNARKQFPNRPELDFFSGWLYFESEQAHKAKDRLMAYLQRDASGKFSEEARAILDRLSWQNPNPLPAPYFSSPANSSTNNAEMVLVPAGFFIMGSNSAGEDERPEHRVHLDEFLIDKYEVSAEKFSRFLNDVSNVNGYYHDNKFGMLFYDGQFHPREGLQSHPINNVNWKAAKAFCRWSNKRLPTEAEWEKAARGTDRRKFPWGFSDPTPELARYFQSWTEEIQHRVMASVDSMKEGQSAYGAHHMAGNVKEWVDDWFDREYYSDSSSQMNPKGPIGGEFKVLRGGSWRDLKGFIYSSFRNNSYPDTRLDDYGFRCAKSTTKDQPPKKMTRLDGFSKANFR